MSKPIPKPAPVVVTTICSLCDEPWELHGDDPTTSDCIRLLKAKIAALPVATPVYIYRDNWWHTPLRQQPYYQPQWTYTQGISATSSGSLGGGSGAGSGGSFGGSNTGSGSTTNNVIEFRTPRDDDGEPQSVRG